MEIDGADIFQLRADLVKATVSAENILRQCAGLFVAEAVFPVREVPVDLSVGVGHAAVARRLLPQVVPGAFDLFGIDGGAVLLAEPGHGGSNLQRERLLPVHDHVDVALLPGCSGAGHHQGQCAASAGGNICGCLGIAAGRVLRAKEQGFAAEFAVGLGGKGVGAGVVSPGDLHLGVVVDPGAVRRGAALAGDQGDLRLDGLVETGSVGLQVVVVRRVDAHDGRFDGAAGHVAVQQLDPASSVALGRTAGVMLPEPQLVGAAGGTGIGMELPGVRAGVGMDLDKAVFPAGGEQRVGPVVGTIPALGTPLRAGVSVDGHGAVPVIHILNGHLHIAAPVRGVLPAGGADTAAGAPERCGVGYEALQIVRLSGNLCPAPPADIFAGQCRVVGPEAAAVAVAEGQRAGIGVGIGGDPAVHRAVRDIFALGVFTGCHGSGRNTAARRNNGRGILHSAGQIFFVRGVQRGSKIHVCTFAGVIKVDGNGVLPLQQRAFAAALGSSQLHGEEQFAVLLLQQDTVIHQIDLNIGEIQIGREERRAAADGGIVGSGHSGAVLRFIVHAGHILQSLAFAHQGNADFSGRLVRPDLRLRKPHGAGDLRLVVLNGDGGRAGVGIDLRSPGFHDNGVDHFAALVQVIVQSLKGDLLFPLAVGKDHQEGIAVIFTAVERNGGVGAGMVIHKVLGHDGWDVLRFWLISLTLPAFGAVLDPIDLIEAAEVIGVALAHNSLQQLRRHDHLRVRCILDVRPSLHIGVIELDLHLPLVAFGIFYRSHQRPGGQRSFRLCIPSRSFFLVKDILLGTTFLLGGDLLGRAFLRRICRVRHRGDRSACADDLTRSTQCLILGAGPRIFHGHLIVLCSGCVGIGHPALFDLRRCGDQGDQRLGAALRPAQTVQGQSPFLLSVRRAFLQIDLRLLEGENAVRIGFLPFFLRFAVDYIAIGVHDRKIAVFLLDYGGKCRRGKLDRERQRQKQRRDFSQPFVFHFVSLLGCWTLLRGHSPLAN